MINEDNEQNNLRHIMSKRTHIRNNHYHILKGVKSYGKETK